eukprot:1307105-Rhodomonas_salina.3
MEVPGWEPKLYRSCGSSRKVRYHCRPSSLCEVFGADTGSSASKSESCARPAVNQVTQHCHTMHISIPVELLPKLSDPEHLHTQAGADIAECVTSRHSSRARSLSLRGAYLLRRKHDAASKLRCPRALALCGVLY